MRNQWMATWKKSDSDYKAGAVGTLFETDGFNDPDSAEYESYCFMVENDERGACYCSWDDVRIISVLAPIK